jgi:anti-anti-sigma regulatory factor
MTDETSSFKTSLKLPPIVDLTTAASLKVQLEQALAAGSGVAIDGGAVARVTSPGLQVLASAALSFRRNGGSGMVFDTMSDALAGAIDTLALTSLFDRRGV